ncbi:MAG TPA: hypothetical protein VIR29_09305 [Anseongella sp.]
MKNRLELKPDQAWQEMEPAELALIKGGSFLVLLAVPAAFRSVYELGRATGRELYHWKHN